MQFNAQVRENFGSSKAALLRASNLIPGSIYNKDGTLSHLSFSKKEITKAVEDYKFLNKCVQVNVGEQTVDVLPKSVDFHPVTEQVVHIEFKEIPETGKVQVRVPIVVKSRLKSIGIKAGGKLNVPSHSLLVECDAKDIPENISIDIGNFGIGRTIFTRHLKSESSYSFPSDVFVLSILGRGRKDKGEDAEVSEESSES